MEAMGDTVSTAPALQYVMRIKQEGGGVTMQEAACPLSNLQVKEEGKKMGCFYTLASPLRCKFMLCNID